MRWRPKKPAARPRPAPPAPAPLPENPYRRFYTPMPTWEQLVRRARGRRPPRRRA